MMATKICIELIPEGGLKNVKIVSVGKFKKKIMMVVVHYIISKIKLSRIKNFQFQILLLLLKVLVILNVLV